MKTLIALCASLACVITAALPRSKAAVPAPASTLETWKIDSGHSSVLFRIKHAGSSMFWGRFNTVSGTLDVDAAKPEASSIKVEIETASIDTNDEKRDQHLKSPDYFSAAEFPTIRFTSTSVKPAGKVLEVTGELELHGKKKPVTAMVEHIGTGEFMGQRTGYEATFNIRRSEFGMTTDIATGALADEVKLIVSLEAVKG